jgi:hypothetical protein
MYANRGTLGKLWILAPILIVLGIVGGLEWIYIDQFLYKYWDQYTFWVFVVSVPFYLNTFMIFANLVACAIVDPGGVSAAWVTSCLTSTSIRSLKRT